MPNIQSLRRQCVSTFKRITNATKPQRLLLQAIEFTEDPEFIKEVSKLFNNYVKTQTQHVITFKTNHEIRKGRFLLGPTRTRRDKYSSEIFIPELTTPIAHYKTLAHTTLDLQFKKACIINRILCDCSKYIRNLQVAGVPINKLSSYDDVTKDTLSGYFNQFASIVIEGLPREGSHFWKQDAVKSRTGASKESLAKFWLSVEHIQDYKRQQPLDIRRRTFCFYHDKERTARSHHAIDIGANRFLSIGHVKGPDSGKYGINCCNQTIEVNWKKYSTYYQADKTRDPIILVPHDVCTKEITSSNKLPYAMIVERNGVFRTFALSNGRYSNSQIVEGGETQANFYLFDNFTVAGDSGAPIVDQYGMLVGVINASNMGTLL